MAAEHLRALGQRVRERREELGLTQEEVARAMPGRVTGARISKWERGENRPHDDSLAELAKALKTSAAALLAPPPDKAATPDPFPAGENGDLAAQLADLGERITRLEAIVEKAFVGRTAQANEIIGRLEAVETAVEAAVNETGGGIIDRLDTLQDALKNETDALLPGIRELLHPEAPSTPARARARSSAAGN